MDHVKHASKKQEINIKAYIYIEKKRKRKKAGRKFGGKGAIYYDFSSLRM